MKAVDRSIKIGKFLFMVFAVKFKGSVLKCVMIRFSHFYLNDLQLVAFVKTEAPYTCEHQQS